MDQLTPLLLLGAAYGIAVAITFQAIKPFAEYWFFGADTTHPLHDATMRLLLFVVALILVLLNTIAGLDPHQSFALAGAWDVVKIAAGATLVALTTYHALNGDILGALTVGGGAAVVQAPPAQPGEDTAVVVPPAKKPTVVVQPPTSTAPSAPVAAATTTAAVPIAAPEAPASSSPPPVASSS